SNVIEITVQPAIANNTVSAAQTICATQTPATLTGTMPTGGNGTYTYLWESSTTSAIAGFTAASGTNNTQNYSAAALTQTTWFRRTVTSGQCTGAQQNISAAIQITVNPLVRTPSTPATATTICQGGTNTCTTSANKAASYRWTVR